MCKVFILAAAACIPYSVQLSNAGDAGYGWADALCFIRCKLQSICPTEKRTINNMSGKSGSAYCLPRHRHNSLIQNNNANDNNNAMSDANAERQPLFCLAGCVRCVPSVLGLGAGLQNTFHACERRATHSMVGGRCRRRRRCCTLEFGNTTLAK